MSALGFLLVALVLSIVGSAVLWLRARQPTSMEHGIEEFRRGMDALRPEDSEPPSGGPSSG